MASRTPSARRTATSARKKKPRARKPGPQPRPPRAERVEPAKASDFIASHAVFRSEDFVAAHTALGRSARTSEGLLRYHVARKHLRRLRNGLYAHPGPIDPWLLGSRLSSDAVIAYEGAFSFHGFADLEDRICVLTAQRPSPFRYDQVDYTIARPPQNRSPSPLHGLGVEVHHRDGLPLRVTSVERTFVDLFDRIDLAPALETVAEAFAAARARALDLSQMTFYARSLGRSLTAARLGAALELTGQGSPRTLSVLEALRPSGAAYFDPRFKERGGSYLSRWNLVVSRPLLSAFGAR